MPEFKKPKQQDGVQSLLVILMLLLALSFTYFASRVTPHATAAAVDVASVAGPASSHTRVALDFERRFSVLDLISRPLYFALNWIHLHIIRNWGWSILALTLCVNLALMPMRVGAMRSQLKLQRLQPEIAKIRARFSGCRMGDPRMQQMNREIQALQEREGISLLGNLMPLLVQMPLLYGFYRMLRNAAELQHASWLWLHDLSAPDPFHMLPLFFLLTGLLLQWFAPVPSAGTDPAQRKIMAVILPLFSCIMTWKAAAGLALYWSCGNLVSLVQQVVMTRPDTTG
jgi:YidC/Oxa1 family membrane protein insertase